MRIVIRKPTRYIEIFRDAAKIGVRYDDAEYLYQLLPLILTRLGFEVKVLETNEQVREYRRKPDDIFFSWHDYGDQENTWYIKAGYLPHYFYFDRKGFSGWSELADTFTPQPITDEIRQWVRQQATYHIENNVTRFVQPYNKQPPSNPYVLVLDQRPDDIVNDLAYINNLPSRVKEMYATTKYEVIVKSSPLHITYNKNNWKFDLEDDAGSLHTLLKNTTAVYTINSSAGFEALLHGKRVFTTGHCDYHWATTTLKTESDLKSSIDIVDEPADQDKIASFLHYCLTSYFMTTKNIDSIERRILQNINRD